MTDTAKLRVGIAGYGVVGKRRHEFIDAHPALQVVAVCDRVLEDGAALPGGIRCHSDYRTLLTEELDILFVCMTNDLAPDVTIAGLERGLHVFCEKPPGRTVEDVERVIATERSQPTRRLKYGFNHRYHDSVKDALALVAAGALGKVINLRGVYGKSKFISFGQHSDWRTDRAIAGGGILLDQGIHMVDLMRLFAGEFETIHSFVSNDYWRHDVEDNAYALMRTGTGIVAMLHSSATQWRHRFQLDITLERGAIVLSGILSGSKSYGQETMTVAYASDDDQGDPREETRYYDRDPSWESEIAEFADAIASGQEIQNGSSNDALKTMQTVYRIYCSDPDWQRRWALGETMQRKTGLR
jgi:predicted dehydrogenase